MKALLFIALSLLAFAAPGPAQAQVAGQIALYVDANRESCCVSGTGMYEEAMYVWCRPTTADGMHAAEFAVRYPSNVIPSTLNINSNIIEMPPFGDMVSGISIVTTECQSDWHWLVEQTIYVVNSDETWISIVPHPVAGGPNTVLCLPGFPMRTLEAINKYCINFCTTNFDSPFIWSVTKVDATHIDVTFSEIATAESAGDASHYTAFDKLTASGTLPIVSAVPDPDGVTVHIALGAPIVPGGPYLLEARDICDPLGNCLTSQKGFGDLPDLAPWHECHYINWPCGDIDVVLTTYNMGHGQSGPFDVQIDWMVYDANPWHELLRLPIRTFHYAGLASGGQIHEHFTFPIPDTLTAYTAVAVTVDPADAVPEESSYGNYETWSMGYLGDHHMEVRDVPGDQGGSVEVVFETISQGGMPNTYAWHEIYRRDPSGWTLMTRINDDGRHRFHSILPTLADSTEAGGIHWSVFKVRTGIDENMDGRIEMYSGSCPDSGYSVDNLPPTAPQGLSASMFDSGITLRWTANPEPDVAKYVLYRDIDPNFIPAPGNRVATIEGALEYFDGDWYPGCNYVYRLRAKDRAGNESPCACTQPDQFVATLLKSYTARLREASVELAWTLSVFDEGARFAVYRADGAGAEFIEIPAAQVSRMGLAFTFVDGSIAGGESYRYRVSYVQSGTTHVLFETETVKTPELPLTLYQNYPNPFNPATTIRYYLPGADRVRLQVFDASGKLVVTLVDAQQQKGSHAAEWRGMNAGGAQVRSGVYFYRLVTRAQTLTHKMVLLR